MQEEEEVFAGYRDELSDWLCTWVGGKSTRKRDRESKVDFMLQV